MESVKSFKFSRIWCCVRIPAAVLFKKSFFDVMVSDLDCQVQSRPYPFSQIAVIKVMKP